MSEPNQDSIWMQRSFELAQHAAMEGEVPVGAVVVRGGEIIGEGDAPCRHQTVGVWRRWLSCPHGLFD